jgi:YidC/Oxa1 family membrane protein insertase
MQRQFLIAILLSFLVIYGWQAMFPPPKPVPPAQQTQPQQVTSAPSGTAAPAAQATDPVAQVPNVEAAKPLVAAAADQDIPVTIGDSVEAVFSNRGATLKSWRLRNYRDGNGAPLELVPQNIAGAVKPFTLEFDDQAITAKLRDALFKPDQTSVTVGSGPSSIAFEYRDADGLVARKTFAFSTAQPYVIRFSADVARNDQVFAPTVKWGPALGTGTVNGGMIYAPSPQPIFYRDTKVTRVAIGKIDAHRTEQGVFGFVGVDDHYFLAALIPSGPQPVQASYDPIQFPAQGAVVARQFISWGVRPSVPVKDAAFFFGPKDFDVLQAVKPDLVRSIDFGMFDWLVVPLWRALKWVDGYVGNYGWSIIVLTVLINIAMFPLSHKSVVSMRKMQEIQPEMKAIQDRYAKLKVTDPGRAKMQEEVMALYKRSGANPAAGCIPMLLKLPVLFAFYAMLAVAIELRGAPFVGWIKDLSVHDPYFVTPVLMGATQFVQTRMQPMASVDPVQQKMMLFMPLMFAGMLLWAPSGLVLYWTVSNLLAIGQQVVTNKLIGPPPQHTVRPAAERQLKNAGSGRSPQAAKERK